MIPSRLAIIAFLTLALAPASSLAKTLPQVVIGGGLQSFIIISNKSTVKGWSGRVFLRQGNEQPWDDPWQLNFQPRAGSSFDVALTPAGTRRFILSGDRDLSPPPIGYIRVEAFDGFADEDITISFFFNILDDEGGLVDSTGVAAADPAKWSRIPVQRTVGINTGIAFAAFEIFSSFDITLRLFDDSGVQIASSLDTYAGQQARFVDELFPGLPADFIGSLQIEADEGLFVTALRQELTTFQLTAVPAEPLAEISSAAFALGEPIPVDFTCDGADISPAMFWSAPLPGVVSWVMIMDDADAGNFVHWVVYDMPAVTRHIPELGGPERGADFLDNGGVHGVNSFGTIGYGGPCPPLGEEHRYFFRLYALDRFLDFPPGASAFEVEQALQGHVIAAAQTMGTFLPPG